MLDVIGKVVELRKVGRRWQGACPFHDDPGISFSVNAEHGLFYCFACGARGNTDTFVGLVRDMKGEAT